MSNAVQAEVGKILENDIVRRPSFFQLKYFILGKEPTIQAKLWCCIRELRSRRDCMEAMQVEMEEIQDNRELLQIQIDRLSSKDRKETYYDRLEKDIAIRKHRRQMTATDKSLEDLRRTLRETEEEADFLAKAFRSLERIEELKPLDDIDAQSEYWNEKYSQKLDLLMLLHRLPDPGFVHDILLLDDKTPVKKKMVTLLEVLQRKALAAQIQSEEETKCRIESQA